MRFSTQVIPFNLIINVLATEANPPATIPQQNILLTRRYNYVLSHEQAAEVGGGGSEVLILAVSGFNLCFKEKRYVICRIN